MISKAECEMGGNGGRVGKGAECGLMPVRGWLLRAGHAVPVWRSREVPYDQTWAAQRPPIQLRSRSIAAPGRASRLGFVSCNRLLCQPGATTV